MNVPNARERVNQPPRIVTEIPASNVDIWREHTILCPRVARSTTVSLVFGKANADRVAKILTAFKLLMRRSRTDAYVTSGDLTGFSLAVLQFFFFWNRKPHVLIDCLWCRSHGLARVGAVLLRKIAAKAATRFVVWESHEIEDYSKEFGVAQDKFEYVHFWHTLSGYDFEVRDEGYVFAGGNWNRDYSMVLRAAEALPETEFVIGTTRPEQLDGQEIPENVSVRGYTPSGFRQAIASCSVMIVPMQAGLLHVGGQQTVLNAMAMGKPVIAVGRDWGQDLIDNGVNGFLADYGDVHFVVSTLRRLSESTSYRQRISNEAMAEGQSWPPARGFNTVCKIACSAHRPISPFPQDAHEPAIL